jgi:hypothetical protein
VKLYAWTACARTAYERTACDVRTADDARASEEGVAASIPETAEKMEDTGSRHMIGQARKMPDNMTEHTMGRAEQTTGQG